MDMYKLKWTLLQQEIFSVLCLHAGKKLSQRDIAKKIKASPTAVANSLKKLKEEHLVTIEKTKTINFVALNRDEKRVIELKRVENLKNMYLSGLSDYLYRELPGATIILFGSYSRGEDTETSDIDVAVIGKKNKLLNVTLFEQMLQREITLHFYNAFTEIQQHLRNNLLNGILLHGGIEL